MFHKIHLLKYLHKDTQNLTPTPTVLRNLKKIFSFNLINKN